MSVIENLSTRNNQLDGLRGYAAVAVIFFHSILGIDPTLISRVLFERWSKIEGVDGFVAKVALSVFNGHTAVVIFFILSGAVLFDSLRRDAGGLPALCAKFLVKRFLRIYPPLFVCLLVCWIAFNVAGIPRSAKQLLENFLLYDFAVNGATWTLNVEAFGAILVVLAFFGYRAAGDAGIILVGCSFAAAYLPFFKGYLFYFKPFIYSFILGMLIPTKLGKCVIGWLPARSWPVLLVSMLFARHSIQETISALLVGMIYYNSASGLGIFLSKPFSIFLGSISYSLYLFNVLFLEIVTHHLRTQPMATAYPVAFGFMAAVPIFVLTVPVACWSFLYIERPSIRLGRKWTERKQGAEPANLRSSPR